MYSTCALMFLMSSTLWSIDVVNIILPICQILDGSEQGLQTKYSNLNATRWFWQSFIFTLEVSTSRLDWEVS